MLGIALPPTLGFSLFLELALPLSCGYSFSSSGSAGLNGAGSCVHLLTFAFSRAIAGSTHGGTARPCREDFAHLSVWVWVLPRIGHTGLPSFVCPPHEMLIVVPPPAPRQMSPNLSPRGIPSFRFQAWGQTDCQHCTVDRWLSVAQISSAIN